MTKKEKESLASLINRIISPMGGSFRWRKTTDQDWNGVFWPESKCIVIKWTAGPHTLAHEIAHLDEYNQFGETDCSTGGRHWNIQQEWTKRLKANGVYGQYLKALG
jgi:hypothetical protein